MDYQYQDLAADVSKWDKAQQEQQVQVVLLGPDSYDPANQILTRLPVFGASDAYGVMLLSTIKDDSTIVSAYDYGYGEAALMGGPRDPGFERKAKKFLEGKTCIACGRADLLQAHHKFPFHLFPDREMDENYWRPLCMGPLVCHLRIGHCGNFKLFNPHVDEDAAASLSRIIEVKKAAA